MKKYFLLFLAPVIFILSCKLKSNTTEPAVDSSKGTHPSWIMQGNIYEVNTRQYTPEGTFNAFAVAQLKSLP